MQPFSTEFPESGKPGGIPGVEHASEQAFRFSLGKLARALACPQDAAAHAAVAPANRTARRPRTSGMPGEDACEAATRDLASLAAAVAAVRDGAAQNRAAGAHA